MFAIILLEHSSDFGGIFPPKGGDDNEHSGRGSTTRCSDRLLARHSKEITAHPDNERLFEIKQAIIWKDAARGRSFYLYYNSLPYI